MATLTTDAIVGLLYRMCMKAHGFLILMIPMHGSTFSFCIRFPLLKVVFFFVVSRSTIINEGDFNPTTESKAKLDLQKDIDFFTLR